MKDRQTYRERERQTERNRDREKNSLIWRSITLPWVCCGGFEVSSLAGSAPLSSKALRIPFCRVLLINSSVRMRMNDKVRALIKTLLSSTDGLECGKGKKRWGLGKYFIGKKLKFKVDSSEMLYLRAQAGVSHYCVNPGSLLNLSELPFLSL